MTLANPKAATKLVAANLAAAKTLPLWAGTVFPAAGHGNPHSRDNMPAHLHRRTVQ